jgi:thymidylate synthase (FAD)
MEVKLIDYMGTDSSIVQAARISYGAGTKTPSDDRSLIRYLLRNRHTTPFEMVEFKFRIKCPIFIARQLMRHRTASINEISARYSIIPNDYYIPKPFRLQSKTNKQGSSDGTLDESIEFDLMSKYIECCENAFRLYDDMIDKGVSRELARCVLPQSTFTEFYWKINLHNILHFLRLRMDPHAQQEIRDIAQMIYNHVKERVPVTTEAYEDYCVGTVTFNRNEITGGHLSKGEQSEFDTKKKLMYTLNESCKADTSDG